MATKTKILEQIKINQKLPTNLSIGPVSLNVKTQKTMQQFYKNSVGLEVLKDNQGKIILGKNNTPLIILNEQSKLSYPSPVSAGLYHTAIRYNAQSALANAVKNILETSPESFSGSADHLVSEAFYFTDPEGNGLELYVDRPKSEWEWEQGQIKMASLYIDPDSYIKNHGQSESKTTEAKMGHVHLKVGNISIAKEFYVDILGFDITAQLPGALFMSVNGYHHHIGVNTWESTGAEKRENTLGLRSITINIKDPSSLSELKFRLQKNNIIVSEKENTLVFSDPWNNTIEATVES